MSTGFTTPKRREQDRGATSGPFWETACDVSAEPRDIPIMVYYPTRTFSPRDSVQIGGVPENTVKTRMFYARADVGGSLDGSRKWNRGWPSDAAAFAEKGAERAEIEASWPGAWLPAR